MLPDREGLTVTVRQGRPSSRGEVSLGAADPTAPPRIARAISAIPLTCGC